MLVFRTTIITTSFHKPRLLRGWGSGLSPNEHPWLQRMKMINFEISWLFTNRCWHLIKTPQSPKSWQKSRQSHQPQLYFVFQANYLACYISELRRCTWSILCLSKFRPADTSNQPCLSGVSHSRQHEYGLVIGQRKQMYQTLLPSSKLCLKSPGSSSTSLQPFQGKRPYKNFDLITILTSVPQGSTQL